MPEGSKVGWWRGERGRRRRVEGMRSQRRKKGGDKDQSKEKRRTEVAGVVRHVVHTTVAEVAQEVAARGEMRVS
jgi:hypothetical protein